MKAVILAAGKGERLGVITQQIPKPMIRIDGKPILEHNILMCKENGIEDIVINLHHLPSVIREYFGNGERLGVRINYSHEHELLGTAGTIKSLSKYIEDDMFVVIYGDNYFDSSFDIRDIVRFHEDNESYFTIALCQIDDVSQSGVAECEDNGKINKFIEKPDHTVNKKNNNSWVNAGFYVLDNKVIENIKDGYSDFGNDVIPLLIEGDHDIYGYKMDRKVKAIDTPLLLETIMNYEDGR